MHYMNLWPWSISSAMSGTFFSLWLRTFMDNSAFLTLPVWTRHKVAEIWFKFKQFTIQLGLYYEGQFFFLLYFTSKHFTHFSIDLFLNTFPQCKVTFLCRRGGGGGGAARIADLIFCLELRRKFISCSEVGTINIIYDFGSWGAFLSLGN